MPEILNEFMNQSLCIIMNWFWGKQQWSEKKTTNRKELKNCQDFNNFIVPEPHSRIELMTVTSRQTMFHIFRNNSTKIGMNTTANKFYQLSGKISLNKLGLSFVNFKKLMKTQFLKYGKK